MKRDMDLIRDILLKIEETCNGADRIEIHPGDEENSREEVT